LLDGRRLDEVAHLGTLRAGVDDRLDDGATSVVADPAQSIDEETTGGRFSFGRGLRSVPRPIKGDEMVAVDSTPAHLRGNGRPVTAELTLTDLAVTGHLPPELDGRYVRNGANPITGMSDHAFFGDGMVHGVRLRDGRAEWYRNRYVRTPFFTNPATDILDPAVMMDLTASKANTHVIGHAGRILALEEGHFPYVLDGDLATTGPLDFAGGLTGSFTAHPKICPATGELLAFGYSYFEPHLRYLRISAAGELVQTEAITVTGPTMMHDFNVTRNHVVFMDLPVVFDLDAAIKGEMPFHWSDSYPARLGVMPREGTDADIRWFDVDPCYVFHPMNAYEHGDTIVLDVARQPHLWRDSMADFPPAHLWRWTIDTATGTVREEQIDDRAAEFPRVPDAHVGLPHRYGYMTAVPDHPSYDDPASQTGALLKYDRVTGARSEITLGRGRLPGEPVFVPADGAAAGAAGEDAGYLMTYVYDAATDASEFVVFDAATMDDSPVATVELPRIPFGFHGSWIPAAVVA
jgi:carotenoid cleavage dioxygenase-like enzyme